MIERFDEGSDDELEQIARELFQLSRGFDLGDLEYAYRRLLTPSNDARDASTGEIHQIYAFLRRDALERR